MMHQKKIAKLKKFLPKNLLHSIPITKTKDKFSKYKTNATVGCANTGAKTTEKLLLHHNFSKLSYSIPLLSSLALLVVLGLSLNSGLDFNKGLSILSNNVDKAYAEGTTSNAPTASATLTIAGNLDQTTDVGLGNGASYRSHNVTYSVNDTTNYTLRISYANGSDNKLKYYGSNGSTETSGGSTVNGVGNNVTGTSINNISGNVWGFAWSNNTSTANESMSYYTMPSYGNGGTGIANGVLTSGNGNINTTGKLSFAAKFDQNAIAGHYKTQVLLSLAATPEQISTYTLTYNTNGGSTAPATQSCTTAVGVITCTTTITNSIPTKTNHEFLGWSTDPNATEADSNYAPNKTITLNSNTTVYAVWKTTLTPTTPLNNWDDLQYMQQMTPEACTAAPSKTPKTLTDSRDSSTYTVAKLDDGKCWMTQNLRITGKTITPSDSDVTKDFTIPSTNTEPANFKRDESCVYYNDDANIGVYYSPFAVTAGSYNTEIATDENFANSICPKGWRLPAKTDYDALIETGGSWDDIKKGYNLGGSFFLAAGRVGLNGSNAPSFTLYGVNTAGRYWSSTFAGSIYLYVLSFTSSSATTASSFRDQGDLVRCIAK